MTSQGMVLRNLALVGQTQKVPMPEQMKPVFEQGVRLLFERWTALQLAIQNEWGGSKSLEKANDLLLDVIDWFYHSKDLEQADLEDLLDEALQMDFNVQAEDDSPYQVARSLVNMHNQVAGGDTSYVESLSKLQPSAAASSLQEERRSIPGQEDDGSSSSSSDEDEGNEGNNEGKGEDMDIDETPAPSQETIIDEDGFQLVQRKGRGNRRR